MIELIDYEDEMLIFNKNGLWVDTIYSSGPEQARSFYNKYKEVKFDTIEEWYEFFTWFKEKWVSKEEEDW